MSFSNLVQKKKVCKILHSKNHPWKTNLTSTIYMDFRNKNDINKDILTDIIKKKAINEFIFTRAPTKS